MHSGNRRRRRRLCDCARRSRALSALAVTLTLGLAGTPSSNAGATAADPAAFVGHIAPLSDAQKAAMTGVVWRKGCPVGLDALRVVHVTHKDARFQTRHGHLVVHKDIAQDTLDVFKALYVLEFPIASITPIEAFGGDDDKSMSANNTSSFNCRDVTGKPGVWSNHSYGRAIDINPQINPYMLRGKALPKNGAKYADRNVSHPMMIKAGDPVVKAFKKAGFKWGGDWSRVKDYQHFEKKPAATKARTR